MDWSFLNIFKRADFNTFMFSLAVTGWIMLYYYPDIIYLKMLAILCSVYCIARLIVYLYNVYQTKEVKKANTRYDEEQKDKKAHDRGLQAQLVYDRLSFDNQKLLQEVVCKGEKSCYSNVYIIKDKISNCMFISQLEMMLYNDDMINNWICIKESQDSYSIHITPPLNSIIESQLYK